MLARARPVAGDAELGRRFLACSDSFVYGDSAEDVMVPPPGTSAQAGEEIEWVTALFQLRHGAGQAPLRRTGTFAALAAMGSAGLIDDAVRRELDHAYVFLRSAEHRRQLGLKEDLDRQLAASRARVTEICRGLVGAASS